jgi:siroheme synthase-like protein
VNFRYPIFLDLSGKRCVVTGEGAELAAKIQDLCSSGAEVIYIHPRADPIIAKLARSGVIEWRRRAFVPADLDGCFLVITASRTETEIFRLAESQNVLCNAVDDPSHCRFIFGSVYRSGDLTIAVSTNGAAPALAVRLRERFQRELGAEYGQFLELLKELRVEIKARIPDFARRRELWYRIIDSPALEELRVEGPEKARATIRGLINETAAGP